MKFWRTAFWKNLLHGGLILFALLLVRFSGAFAADSVSICTIQGSGVTSPYAGQNVITQGVVTIDLDQTTTEGFYIQTENCDSDDSTSDGIFVFINEQKNVVTPGDWVLLQGQVVEFGGETEIIASPADIFILSTQPIPAAVELNPPQDDAQSAAYFEAREGMRVQISAATVVGPTTSWGDTFVVPTTWAGDHVFRWDANGAGNIIPVDKFGPEKIDGNLAVGDSVVGLEGWLGQVGGAYRMSLTVAPTVTPAPLPLPSNSTNPAITFATLNLHNLFDTNDAPDKQDPLPTAGEFQRHLRKTALGIRDYLNEPLFIGVQEVENGLALQALANRPELQNRYDYKWYDGPDFRGIDVALLYQADRVNILESRPLQGCTTLADGLGPDGNRDIANPQNALTCSTTGSATLDGNRIFSRPPLLVRAEVCDGICTSHAALAEYWIMVVHFKSKTQDTATTQYTLPRRLEQAAFIAQTYQNIISEDPRAQVIILGDFNDYLGSAPLRVLGDAGLFDMVNQIPPAQRYTYIYDGVAQVLDHILVNSNILISPLGYPSPYIAHFNANYPASWETAFSYSATRASDHDPVLLKIVPGYQTFLPLTIAAPEE